MMRLQEISQETIAQAPVRFDHEPMASIVAKFPSFQFFYASDDKTMLDTANSLLIMDLLISGTEKDYRKLIRLQKKDVLTFDSFIRLSCFFSPFRNRFADLRNELALFVYLDGLCRTAASKKLVIILPADQRGQNSRDSLALAIIKNKLLAEVQQLESHNRMILEQAFSYRLTITNQGPGYVVGYNDDAIRVAQAGVICDIAGLPHDPDELGASLLLSESMAKQLLGYTERAYLSEASKELCSLTIN